MLAAILIYTAFTVFFCYSTMAPFFPSELERRGLNRLWNSIVFAVFSFSYVICALLAKKLFIPACGRVGAFIIATIALLASLVIMALLPLIPNDTLFLICGILARIIQGGGGCVQVLNVFAILSLAYKEKMSLLHNFV